MQHANDGTLSQWLSTPCLSPLNSEARGALRIEYESKMGCGASRRSSIRVSSMKDANIDHSGERSDRPNNPVVYPVILIYLKLLISFPNSSVSHTNSLEPAEIISSDNDPLRNTLESKPLLNAHVLSPLPTSTAHHHTLLQSSSLTSTQNTSTYNMKDGVTSELLIGGEVGLGTGNSHPGPPVQSKAGCSVTAYCVVLLCPLYLTLVLLYLSVVLLPSNHLSD